MRSSASSKTTYRYVVSASFAHQFHQKYIAFFIHTSKSMSLKRFSQPFRRKPDRVKHPRPIFQVPEGGFTRYSYGAESNNDPESDEDDDVLENPTDIALDDTLTEDVEITAGGWVCRVERFEKFVDSSGRIRYYRQRKESPSPLAKKDKTKESIQQSIISYFHHTTKTRTEDLIDPDIYIQIKSPLILEVLRKNTSYGHQV